MVDIVSSIASGHERSTGREGCRPYNLLDHAGFFQASFKCADSAILCLRGEGCKGKNFLVKEVSWFRCEQE